MLFKAGGYEKVCHFDAFSAHMQIECLFTFVTSNVFVYFYTLEWREEDFLVYISIVIEQLVHNYYAHGGITYQQ